MPSCEEWKNMAETLGGHMDCEGSDLLLPVIAASVIDRLWNNNKQTSEL